MSDEEKYIGLPKGKDTLRIIRGGKCMVEFNYPKKGVRMRVMCIREKEGFTLGRRDRYFRYYKIAKKKKGFEEKD